MAKAFSCRALYQNIRRPSPRSPDLHGHSFPLTSIHSPAFHHRDRAIHRPTAFHGQHFPS